MIVQPELPDHPDFLMLKSAVGDYAMEALIRLWAHCQNSNRGEIWLGRNGAFVETVARWTGNRGELFRALLECSWVEEIAGGVKILNWERHNAKLVSARSNGTKGGRPRKTEGKNPTETDGKPNSDWVSGGFPAQENGGSTEVLEKPTANPSVTQPKPTANPRLTHPSISLSISSLSLSELQAGAREIIALLNRLTGSSFNPPLVELDEIVARLQETGGDLAGVQQMVRRQVALWQPETKSRHWLKPSTLFGTRFHDYYGQRAQPVLDSPGKKSGGAVTADRTELLETLAAARAQLEKTPADGALQDRVRELELQTT